MKLDKRNPSGVNKSEDRGRMAEGLNVEQHGHPKTKSIIGKPRQTQQIAGTKSNVDKGKMND